MLKFLHAADFHLDGAFSAADARQAASRRRERRELIFRMADYVNQNEIKLILIAGDLFDSAAPYRESIEETARALGGMRARVFIAPGEHDWYESGGLWDLNLWPDNVTIFKKNKLTAVRIPDWNLVIYGAAFTGPKQTQSFFKDFTVPRDGRELLKSNQSKSKNNKSQDKNQDNKNQDKAQEKTRKKTQYKITRYIGVTHGELCGGDIEYNGAYNPVSPEDVSFSGLDYLALGHIHEVGEPVRLGKTLCAWPGCPEGRGFDEPGEKGFYIGDLADNGAVSLKFIPFAGRRYESIAIDVTGGDPVGAIEAVLPPDTARDFYRIILTGEVEADDLNLNQLREIFSGRFYSLELRDYTSLREDIWARMDENSLRGLFLRELRNKLDSAKTERDRRIITRAARVGLAALDRRDPGL